MSGNNYYNSGNVNIDALKQSIINNGGVIDSHQMADGGTHYTAHYMEKGRTDRCSWNEDQNGNISDVHTSRDNGDHTDYKGGY